VVLADGEDGEHTLEVEVNGIHVSLENQNEWKKGENTIVVTLKDSTGSPINDADVEIMILPKSEERAQAEDSHGASEPASGHEADLGHSSVPGTEVNEHGAETSGVPAHDEAVEPISLSELEQHGIYTAETHFESSGTHEISIMFHANGEMLEANFVVEIPGVQSKTIVLWSFVAINVVLITSAGILKKQSVPVKGQ
jgi:hypothetical protein